jgi:hypothetical protein
VVAVTTAAPRAPAAIADLAMIRRWRGAGPQLVRARAWCWPASVPRRAGSACMTAAVDRVMQLEEASAGRRAGEVVG